MLSMNYPTRRTTKILVLFTLHHHHHHRSTAHNQPCHPPFHPPNSRLSLPKPSPPKPPHTVCTEYIIPDTQSANPQIPPSPSIITALKYTPYSPTLTHPRFQALTPTSALERASSPHRASTSSARMSRMSHFRWRLALRG